ncbi:hypothetical protein NP233_g2323 [Leucocoprinus birnbaumii]|uniref:Protein kinase domain-containing protein n=1 Tax=Leucocoprinus birnbaumii TaxID=56174 RepID=A0AAD5VZ28_9AGAR|nr:hypothetical protein NP233_g2323 [Leucocoprinus birnbaumii]
MEYANSQKPFTFSMLRKVRELFLPATRSEPSTSEHPSASPWNSIEYHCISLFLGALNDSNPSLRTQLENFSGEDAQTVVDFIASLFVHKNCMNVENAEGRRSLQLLCRLTASAGVYPRFYALSQIKADSRKVPLADADEGIGYFYRASCGRKGSRVDLCLRPHKKTSMKDVILRANISHVNILPFHGVYDVNGQICTVFPHPRYKNLNEIANQTPQSHRLPWLMDVLNGACYLHELDIVHGDLRTVNVLVTPSGSAMITNLGVSSIGATELLNLEHYMSDLPARWAAPEILQCRLEKDRDPDFSTVLSKAIDIWSLGCLIYRVLSRIEPFDEHNDNVVTAAVIQGRRPHRPNPQKELNIDSIDDLKWDAIAPCWNTAPDSRPSCQELRTSVSAIMNSPSRKPRARDQNSEMPHWRDGITGMEIKRDFARLFALLGGVSQTRHLIRQILDNKEKARGLRNIAGSDAQEVVDFLSETLLATDMRSKQGMEVLDLLRELTSFSLKFPRIGMIQNPVSYNGSELIGEGELGRVYKTCYGPSNQFIRLKVVPELSDTQAKRKEIHLLSPFMINGSLRKYLQDSSHYSETLTLLFDTANGLAYLHQIGIIHTNLHGGNVLVSGNKRAIIADVGLSQTNLLTETITSNPRTRVKIHRMAPECVLQLQASQLDVTTLKFDNASSTRPHGHREADENHANYGLPTTASDVWSLGCLFHESFFGRPPYASERLTEIVHKFIRGLGPERPSQADDVHWTIVSSCLDLVPGRRLTCKQVCDLMSPHLRQRAPTGLHTAITTSQFPNRVISVDYSLVYERLLEVLNTSAESEFPLSPCKNQGVPLPVSIQPPVTMAPEAFSEGEDTNSISSEALCRLLLDYLLTMKPRPASLFGSLAADEAQLAANYLEKISLATQNTRDRRRLRRFLIQLIASTEVVPQSYELPEILLEQLHSLQPVDHGGFGSVYKADLNGCIVAAKVARNTTTKDAKIYAKELTLWVHLEHPNILPLIGVSMLFEKPALISPWMKNGNLYHYVCANRECNRIALIVDVVRGLQYLHGLDIVHGDLKGRNVLISNDLRAMITDFGFSVTAIFSTGSTYNSKECFTGRWAAPETLNERESDTPIRPTKAGDIWSLGCLIYEVLSRKVPYHRRQTNPAVIAGLLLEELPSRPGLDDHDSDPIGDDMWALMLKCWSFNSGERPTCQEVLEALGASQSDTYQVEDNLMHAFQRARNSADVDYERAHKLLQVIVAKEKSMVT